MSNPAPSNDPAGPVTPNAAQTPPPVPGKKKNFLARHKVLTVLGSVVVLIIVISVAATAGKGDPEASTTGGKAAAADSTPGLNTAVTSGKLRFTALSMTPTGATVGTAPLNATAQGQFVTVKVRVENVSDSPQTFIINYLQLTDAKGRSYDADPTATLYAAANAQTWIAAINPGNSVEGPVIFDIPKDAAPTAIVVKDSILSGGTTIKLK